MTNTPRAALPELAASQAQKHVTHNEALLQLDALLNARFLSRALSAPPAMFADGDAYLVKAAGTGIWAGQDGKIAYAVDGAWRFYAPFVGLYAFISDESIILVYTATGWKDFASVLNFQNVPQLGVNTAADATNKLAVASAAVLFNNIGNGIQVKLNKNAAADTASFLFQTLFSGRAEMGTTGDDDFHFKVSPDGAAWYEGLKIARASGLMTVIGDPVADLGVATKQYVDTIGNAFIKADTGSAVFTKTGAGTIGVKAGTRIGLAGKTYYFAADTAVTMPALTAGTDYAIYMCNDGTIRADANFSAPAGYTAAQCRKIGGFHYAPGGNAAAQLGGDATPAINPYSIWDLKWKPACPDPRGMALIANGFWCDIYICNTAPETNGTSGYNLTIADGASPPKIPTAFGGDGVAAYASFNWWEAGEVMSAAGKQLLSYAEFAAAAYGTTEGASFGTDPGSTILRNAYTSRWGIMLATGNMWVWGRDLNYYLAGGVLATDEAFSWKNNAGGRGQVFTQGTVGLSAALFGGDWFSGAVAGSRASYWSAFPWYSNINIGARGRCDHLILA